MSTSPLPPTQNSNNEDYQMTPPLPRDNPLQIPQILEMIFSNLSSYQARHLVLPVCHQWYEIAQTHAFRSIAWSLEEDGYEDNSDINSNINSNNNDNNNSHSNRSEQCRTGGSGGSTGQGTSSIVAIDPLKHLDAAQRLFIRADQRVESWRTPLEWKSSFTHETWQALQDAMATKPHPLKISDLQLLCPIDFEQAFELLIQIGSSLTTLRLESTRRDGNLLDSILNVCTKLKELTVEFSCSDEMFYQESFRGPWHPSIGVANPTPNPSLRSLSLRRIVMDEELLLILVHSCPGLEDLVLDQVTGIAHRELEVQGGRTHVASVFRSLASIRPGLRRFGFLPCVITKTTELVQARIVPLFSMATEWVFPATSFLSVLELCGWPDDILNRHRWTMLTSLEILVRHKDLNPLSLGLSLHQYLCTLSLSRHLLKLKAPGVQVPLDCLDIEGVVSAVGSYRQADHPIWSSTLYDELGPRRNNVWGCRDLRVLHVQIQCSKGDCGSDASSRLVFGYISKACPMLENLRLQKEHLSLSIGGGLCLLRRLNRLKSLALTARDGIWHTAPELDWMSNELSSRQLDDLRSFISQSVSEEVFSPVYRRFPLDYQAPDVPGTPSWKHTNVASGHELRICSGKGDETSLDMLVVSAGTTPNFIIGGVDMRYLAQLRDVVEELKRRISGCNASCWPNMECLEITRKDARPWGFINVVEKTEAQMHLMRPDIEFQALWK